MRGETSVADDEVMAVWRVGGGDFDVDAFLRRFPEFEPDGFWRKGESQGRRGSPAVASGFNVTLIEGCSRADLAEELHLALDDFREEMKAAGQEAEQSVDIGLMVGVDALVSGLRFEVPLMRRLADLRIELELSVYLCSSDEDDDEQQGPLN